MVLDLVLIGLAIAFDPLPLTAFIVVLPSQRGAVKGAAFVFGWLVSLAIVVAVTVLATGNNPAQAEHGTLPCAAGGEDRDRSRSVRSRIAGSGAGGPPRSRRAAEMAGAWTAPWSPWAARSSGADRRGCCPAWAKLQLGAPRAVRVLRHRLGVLPRHGALRCVQARPEQGIPGQVEDLDRHPYRPGDHLRELEPRLLARRKQHLPHRHMRRGVRRRAAGGLAGPPLTAGSLMAPSPLA